MPPPEDPPPDEPPEDPPDEPPDEPPEEPPDMPPPGIDIPPPDEPPDDPPAGGMLIAQPCTTSDTARATLPRKNFLGIAPFRLAGFIVIPP
jgi:hypothetical protein